MSPLVGRRALVTGAGQGIGRAIAEHLAAAGAEVAVNDYHAERAASVATAIRDSGGVAWSVPFDVADLRGVRESVEASGPFHILVNNAGNGGAGGWSAVAPFEQTDPADWQATLGVNLYGVMHCVHTVLPGMIAARWGRIVTVVSDAGRVGEPDLAVYGAAKAGAAALTRSVAREAGRYGVTANNVALATVRTPESPELPDAEARLKRYVVRRFGTPQDVAGMVGYLAGEAAGWITGQTYPVNGGYSFAL